ncbi:proteasome regulatory particle base [Salix suchowensis]|nr:proteasome regulatory particle base [Salix suchowensis]
MPQPTEFSIRVTSDDPKKKEDSQKDESKVDESKLQKDDANGEGEELSEEDLQLKTELEMLVERLKEPNTELYKPALETLRTLIRTSTSSMTSVPKPLKFLRPHYPDLQVLYETWPSSEEKSLFADILSVLAMTYSDTQPRGTLRYRLLAASLRPASAPLTREEFTLREEEEDPSTDAKPVSTTGTIDELRALAKECATFLLTHNAEPDAVDLLQEMEIVEELANLVDENTYGRVCQYMIRCVNLLPPPDDVSFLRTAHQIYVRFKKFPEALSLSIRIGDKDLLLLLSRSKTYGLNCLCRLMKRQLAFLLARDEDAESDFQDELPEDLAECLTNAKLSTHFRDFGKELGVSDPKSLEDIYKSHLDNTRAGGTVHIDSARGNLAGTFVNAFAEEGNSWIYKNKDHGEFPLWMMSASASLGLSLLWDTEIGLSHVDKYTYSAEEHIKVCPDADAALALLGDYVENKAVSLKTSAIIGLGLAYVGSHREELLLAALSLGFIFVGSEHGDVASTILQTLMERDEKALDEKWSRFMVLGLALLYLGKQDASDATVETLKAIEHPVSKTAQILVEACAFAATGNVLKEEKEEDKKQDDTFQAFAVIAIAMIAMGEDIGAEMSLRQFNHLVSLNDPKISASNPQLPILDTLSKYSHDSDLQVAINAIFAMGLVGAGTNNARLAQMLRQLAGYYYKEPDCLFMVRIAQGLIHMGKGTIGVNPFFCDRNIMSPSAVAGLLATLTAFTDSKAFVLDKYHWMLYFISTAMYPRFLITLDEELNNLPVTVRVGQALDVVGQAGKPRTISGFQTHQTPVRLGTTERAELATEEYIPFAHVLEGFVILQKNPGWEKEDKMEL